MKHEQDPLNKAPNNGEKKEQRERTRAQAKRAKPQVGHKRALEQIMF